MRKGIRTAAQTAVLMAVLTLISKLFGFVREMVMANYFGASFITDAYAMSFSILTVLFGGIIIAVSTAYMPVYSRINENNGKLAGDRFTSRILNILLIISIFISFIGIVLSDQLIALLAAGFKGETARLASFFIKVLFSYVIFSSTAGILEAYLQYKGVFLPQIISGYSVSICAIIIIIISAYTSYYYLAFGMLTGYFVRFILIAIIARKNQFKYTPDIKFNEDIKNVMILAAPTFIGSYAHAINQYVDKTLASGLAEGSISALNYASMLNGLISGLTVTILSTIIYPKLAQAVSLKDYDRLNNILGSGLSTVIIIVLPFSLGILAYSEQVVQIVYERGAFDPVATAMTGSAFFYYAGGLMFSATSDLIIKTFYSIGNTKTPMIIAVITVLLNIVLNLILVKPMAHNGLALATSISALFNTMMLWTVIRKEYKHIELVNFKNKLIRIIISAAAAVGASYLFYTFFILPLSHIIIMRTVQLSLAVIVAAVIYLLFLKLFKISELELLLAIFKRG